MNTDQFGAERQELFDALKEMPRDEYWGMTTGVVTNDQLHPPSWRPYADRFMSESEGAVWVEWAPWPEGVGGWRAVVVTQPEGQWTRRFSSALEGLRAASAEYQRRQAS